VAVAQVLVIAAAPASDAIQRLAGELRRDALRVDVASADVLRIAPAAPLYVFCFEAGIAVAMAARVVAWADNDGQRVGLIGVIEDGGGHEREALLAAGFDDVVAGRLSTRELSARVRAVHRRIHRASDWHGRLRFGSFTLDPDNYALWAHGVSIALTPIELSVMRELMKARGKPLSRAELLDAAWGEGELEISERAVDNVILRLRRKLPDPDAVETVRGVGFRITS
jgi:DNA-binding response OmpR family regulator